MRTSKIILSILFSATTLIGFSQIKNPKTEDKTYHWCSCGMSKKQPFCDRSHKGTGFKPVNFKIGEKVESIFLCGCKLSSKIPLIITFL